ncbi:MAG: Fur family transcriptional regulator [Phocaeicola sp.]|uniref:Fur family transcriptional regulator n=1 Tax=Phocaeicola TaxID=909656 RepID=UPI00234EA552|nr:transcriptional repressor [Phocaeicola oris]MCE2615815.1 transcriptional repressor [Phocaeicola oris]
MKSLSSVERMTKHGIHPTATRILVLDEMLKEQRPISLSELEEQLDTVDKSTVFRALTLFLKHHLIHAIEDGSGALKYEVCEGEDYCDDMHTHFYCEICHQTFCLKDVPVPIIQIPEGFEMHFVNYMIKGICKNCSINHRIHENI